jgi:autoinducer 2 (AI-2) kinase
MTSNYLLGFDIGGGGGRCSLVNGEKAEITSAFRTWRHPAAGDVGEWAFSIDTDLVWRTLADLVAELLLRSGVSPGDIAGVAAAGMRHGMVVIDDDGRTLLSRSNQDARSVSQAFDLAGRHGEEIYQRSGHWPSPINPGPALLWMAEEMPASLQRAKAMLSLSDWIGYKLTGQIVAEPSQAAESLLFDLHRRAWADDLIADLRLPRRLFPEICPAGTLLGELLPEAGSHLGLPPGVPVAVGAADTQSGLLGLGAVAPGHLGLISGTTAPLQLVINSPHIDPEKRLWTSSHLVPGLYVLESNAGGMGASLEWFARTLYHDHPHPIAALMAEAGLVKPGESGVFSTLGVSIFNAANMTLPVDNITFSTANRMPDELGRPVLARAALEGQAFGVRANLEQIQRVANLELNELRLAGGKSRSPIWGQILSQVTGLEVKTSAGPDATALGAAICAGVGAGLYPDLGTGVKTLSRFSPDVLPGDEEHKRYQSLYQDWLALRRERASAEELAASILTQNAPTVDTFPGREVVEDFRPRIYVSADMGEDALKLLRRLGEVTYASYREGNMLVGEELVETLQGYQVFVTEVDIVDAEALQSLPDLRLVVACRGNPVNVDIPACSAAGVLVLNTPGRNADAVADLTLVFLLMLARKLPEAAEFLRQPGSEAGDVGRMGMAYFKYQGNELWRKTVGLVGAGAIGRRVIKRLLPFETNILIYDPYIDDTQALLLGARKVTLDELLTESDFISLHTPVTEETRNLLDTAAFEKMKSGVFLVNTARAALIDEAALITALESGKVAGAALDVFAVEPPGADDPLLAFENVIATPHLGGDTVEVGLHQGIIVADELESLLNGGAPDHALNPDVLSAFSWTGARQMSRDELMELAKGPEPVVSDLHAESPSEPSTAKKGGFLKRLFGGKEKDEAAARMASAPTAVSSPAASASGTAAGSQHETMVRILAAFTQAVATDPELAEASRGKDVLMHFTIKDLQVGGGPQTFYLHFADQMAAALGDPADEPHVRLKMDADIFDGMFTGRISGNKAAMTGKLSFSGDTRKAMSLQRFTKHLSRLYKGAIQQVGDPGDLTQLSASAKVTAASAAQADEAPVYSPSTPVEQKVGDVRDEILAVTNELYARGLITASGGNISARVDDNPNEVWITPSAIFKGNLRADMMVRIDLDGKLVGDNDYSASSERRVHCAIYRMRPDISAVVHSHAPQATLMGLTGTSFQPISTEAAFVGDVPVVPFIMPGTQELGDQVAEALGDGVAVIMQNHGLVVAGTSPQRAADMTEIVETTAEKLLLCRAMNVQPELLPDDVLEELHQIGKMMV